MGIFSVFFNMKVCCVFSLELPQYKKDNYPKLSQICSYGFLFQSTQERV